MSQNVLPNKADVEKGVRPVFRDTAILTALSRELGRNVRDKTDAEIINLVGHFLYGNDYRLPMAKALGRDYRWIQRWSRGRADIPADAYPQLLKLVQQRNRDYAR
jgi:hypothetical protein